MIVDVGGICTGTLVAPDRRGPGAPPALPAAVPVRPQVAGQRHGASLISRADCLKTYPYAVNTGELCTEDLSADAAPVEACDGDSGGPVLAQGPVQIGITSWGAEVKNRDCGKARLPDVAMRVAAFGSFNRPDARLRPRARRTPPGSPAFAS